MVRILDSRTITGFLFDIIKNMKNNNANVQQLDGFLGSDTLIGDFNC